MTCLVRTPSALLTAFVSMTTPGGAHSATATWAKVVRAAQKVGPWRGEEHGGGLAPLETRVQFCGPHVVPSSPFSMIIPFFQVEVIKFATQGKYEAHFIASS